MEEKNEEVSSYKMKLELENQRYAEEEASQNLQFQAEKEVLEKQVTTERNDRLAMKKDLEERLESQEKQHMAAAEELISLYEKKLSLAVAKQEELQQQYDDLKVPRSPPVATRMTGRLRSAHSWLVRVLAQTAAEAKHAELIATNTATQNHILSQFKHKVATQRKAHADLKVRHHTHTHTPTRTGMHSPLTGCSRCSRTSSTSRSSTTRCWHSKTASTTTKC